MKSINPLSIITIHLRNILYNSQTLAFYFILITSSIAADYPVLPQILIHTQYNLPTGGQLIKVNTSAAFQSALNSANLGDIIELKSGNTFTGPFTLPKKITGSGWIYIISSAYANLPSPCTRVGPSDGANTPKIVVSANNGGAINTASGAHHYRFVDIEF